MSFIMIVICQVGLKQTMAFVVDEKQRTPSCCCTTLRNNYCVGFKTLLFKHDRVLCLFSKSDPLLKYGKGLRMGTDEDFYFIELS